MHWLHPGEGDYPVLDHAYLDRLAGCIGSEQLRELMSDGLIDLSDKLGTIEEHAALGDRAAVASNAHTMIGVAGQLGLTRLALAAADLERAARDGEAALADPFRHVAALATEGLGALAARIEPEGA